VQTFTFVKWLDIIYCDASQRKSALPTKIQFTAYVVMCCVFMPATTGDMQGCQGNQRWRRCSSRSRSCKSANWNSFTDVFN